MFARQPLLAGRLSLQPVNADWPAWLLRSTQAMAAANQNPVLAVLPDDGSLVVEQKYPSDRLRFCNGDWRGFYHYHQAPGRPEGEHGHFHFFVRTGDTATAESTWSHLAALSMDGFGQPMRWFTVNRWVTDGPWLTAEQLIPLLDRLPDPDDLSTLEQWLVAMLGLYQESLAELLRVRDRQLSHINAVKDDKNILENRDVYQLSSSPIDLLARLKQLCDPEGQTL